MFIIKKTIIVADDLTGANDTGLQFAKQGKETKVLIGDADQLSEIINSEVCVINTESRSLPSNQAYGVIERLSNEIKKYNFSMVFKKIDSTFRGNVGVEISSMMEHMDFDFAVIAPAYPRNGRKTVGGYHIVNDQLIEDSEFSNDPKFPVNHSFLPDLLQNQTTSKVVHFDINKIRSGKLHEEIERHIKDDKPLFIFDCAVENDFDLIINAAKQKGKNILWVGSAGLMGSLSKSEKQTISGNNQPDHDGPFLVVAGSVSAKTKEQIAYIKDKGFKVIKLNAIDLLKDNFDELKLPHWEKIASDYLNENMNIVITTESSPESREQFNQFLAETGLEKEKAGDLIAEKLGLLGSRLISKGNIKGVFLTGGDIAYQTSFQLGLKAFQIVDEVEEGIPLCKANLQGLENIPFVTKAGAFGNKHTMYNAILKMTTI